MEIKQLLKKHYSVCFDTPIFIYLLDGNNDYFEFSKELLTAVMNKKLIGITSIITPIEVLSTPSLENEIERKQHYYEFFKSFKELTIKDITINSVETISRLRRVYGIRTPDAIQLAIAIEEKAQFFITNDERLKQIQEVKVILLKDIH